MINKNEEIDVLNYWDQPSFLVSQGNEYGYKVEGQMDGEPSVVAITFSDIKYINTKSDAFKDGVLLFEPERQEEVYKELKIYPDKNKNYFTRQQIEDIILDPNDDKIRKIVEITSLSTITSFRKILVKLTNDNEYDISNRVREYIDAREYELKNKKISSALPIPKSKVYVPVLEKEENIETAVVEEKEEVKETKTKAPKSATK